MSTNEESDFSTVPARGVLTRSQTTLQVITEPTDDATSVASIHDDATSVASVHSTHSNSPKSAYDHLLIDILGWQTNSDCYQALLQCGYNTVRAIVVDYTHGTAATLRFNGPDRARLAPPVMMLDNRIGCFQNYLSSLPEYLEARGNNDVLEQFINDLTPDAWYVFQADFVSKQRAMMASPFQPDRNSPYQTPDRASIGGNSNSSSFKAPETEAERFLNTKRDKNDFKAFSKDGDWFTWSNSTKLQMKHHKCENVLDPDYVPTTQAAIDLHREQCAYVMSVWDRILKTHKGQEILRNHCADNDAQAVWKELCDYYTTSTRAKLENRALYHQLHNIRFDPDETSVTYEVAISNLLGLIVKYESGLPDDERLSKAEKLKIVQSAVQTVPCLNSVINNVMDIEAVTGSIMTYDNYVAQLIHAATVHDEQFRIKSGARAKITKRNVYSSTFNGDATDEITSDVDYEAYTTRMQRSGFTPRLNHEQWTNLSTDDKTAWDTISDSGKSTILSRTSASSSSSRRPRKVQFSDFTLGDLIACVHELQDGSTEDDHDYPDTSNTSQLLVQAAKSLANKHSGVPHPGAMKNMLSTRPPSKSPDPDKRVVKYSERLAYTVDYRVSNNIRVNNAIRHSLIDRGANGGVGGEDVRLLHFLPGRTVNIQGIDDHQLSSIRLGTVAGVIETRFGPLVLIFHQYAYTGRGASIHSPVHLEDFGCRVEEKARRHGGEQLITTPNGYHLPLVYVDGLARLPLRPPTDVELESLPQEITTSELDWEPRKIDDSAPDVSQLPHPSEVDVGEDHLFDEFGDLRGYHVSVGTDDRSVDTTDDITSIVGPDGSYSIRDVLALMHDMDSEPITGDIRRAYIFDDDTCSVTDNGSLSDDSLDQYDVSAACQYLAQQLEVDVIAPFSVPSSIMVGTNDDAQESALDFFADQTYQTFAQFVTFAEARAVAYSVFNHAQQVTPRLTRQLPDFEALRPQLAYQPLDIVRKTFENTTQLACLSEGTVLKKHYKSPNPALNVERRNEGIATDTIFADVNALGRGIKEAQLFVGVDTLVTDVFPMKSQKQFAKTLMDVIILRGAPSLLISDGAQAETSAKVKEILRTLIFPQWISEADHQHQNKSERRIQDVKRIANTVLDRSGAPADLWFECLLYVCDVLNHSFNDGIDGVPLQKLDGHTPDLSAFMLFRFYEKVLYRIADNTFPSESREELGHFVGISRNVGNAMTFRIVTLDTRRIISRSGVRSASHPTDANLRVAPLSGEELISSMSPAPSDSAPHIPSAPSTLVLEDALSPNVIKTRADLCLDDGEKTKRLVTPTVHPNELIGRTFLMDDNRNDGQFFRGKIIEVIDERPNDTVPIGQHPEHIKFRCSINNGEFVELLNYQRLMDYLQQDSDNYNEWKFDKIIEHQGPLTNKDDGYDGSSWNVKIQQNDGTTVWKPLKKFAAEHFVECAIYARDHGLLELPGWRQFKKVASQREEIFKRQVHQAKLRSYRTSPRYKYGFEVPRNFNHAVQLDKENGNTRWMDAIRLENEQLFDYKTFQDKGHKDQTQAPEGYKRIRCHYVFDVKFDGRHKARFVADGNLTDLPLDDVYSGVVSIKGIRLVIFLSELNRLQLVATDVGNAYLEAYTKEKVYFIAGPEFGSLHGHILVIVKALYGLRTSGARWHDRFADVLRDMGFGPSMVEPDIWMRRNGELYEYIAVYVDDLLIAALDPYAITDALCNQYHFKLKGTGDVKFHLGMDFIREGNVLHIRQTSYLERLFAMFERIFGHPPRHYFSPLSQGDHPELDTSEFLDDEKTKLYQSLIGALQWVVTIGKFDIYTAVMTMASFRAQPRQGHMERVKHIFGYLSKFRKSSIRVLTDEPDYLSLPDVDYDWKYSVYGNVEEIIPSDAPKPLGKPVMTTTYVDANLYHCMLTGKAVTGVLHFVNKTPWDWLSRKQSTVETATYGSEFSAAKTATDQIIELRQTLRYLGVPIRQKSVMFGDNKTVVDSASLPNARLHKRHTMLNFHRVRQTIASNILAFHFIPGEQNPSDILSKTWGYSQVWDQILQPMLFWYGNTADIPTMPKDNALDLDRMQEDGEYQSLECVRDWTGDWE